MKENDNTGLGLIKAVIERVQNGDSLFGKALKELVNSTEDDLQAYIDRRKKVKVDQKKEKILIKKLNGGECICNSKVFKKIDQSFIEADINERGLATEAETVSVFTLSPDFTAKAMFSYFPNDWDRKWLTQNQVIEFCRNNSEFFSWEGPGLFFLIKKDEFKPINESRTWTNLTVVRVRDNFKAETLVSLHSFGDKKKWGNDKYPISIVIPDRIWAK